MHKTLNLTQHPATPDQVTAGVRDFDPELRARLGRLLTVQMSGPDGFATLGREKQRAFLETRAGQIISDFILPEVESRCESLTWGSDHPTLSRGIEAINEIVEDLTIRLMLAGFGPLIREIERRLADLPPCRFEILTALSDRVSVEKLDPETGKVVKTLEFEHLGFYAG